jgi:uncharacterized repeat protein (TIGR01451 family)
MACRYTALALSWLAVVVLVPGVGSASWPDQEESLPWLTSVESEGVIFFAYQTPPSVERYSMASRNWLATIFFDDVPTALTVDADGLYVSFGRRTSRFTRSGTGETHLRNSNYDAENLFTVGDVLFISDGTDLMAIDKNDGTLIDNSERYYSWYRMTGFSVAPTLGFIFARSTGVSPSDILQIAFSADGTIGDQEDSTYHGDFPNADRCYVFPDESLVADNSGTVYETRGLRYAGSFGGAFADLTFSGAFAYIVRDGTIVEFTNRVLRSGEFTPANRPLKIVVSGSDIISFYQGTGGVEAEALPLSLLGPREPGGPVDPKNLVYEPDSLAVAADGSVLLLSSINHNVFRWSVDDNRYLASIPLLGGPDLIAYSNVTDTLYVGYRSLEITQIPLDGAEVGDESPFVNTAYPPQGLSAAGEYVFVVDESGGWHNHTTYDPDGSLISQDDLATWAEEFVWNQSTRRMYFIGDWPSLEWEEIDEDGVIGEHMESYDSSYGETINPVRVRPDGALVVIGSGRLYDGESLAQVDTLSNNISDAVWIGDQLYTLRSDGSGSQLQTWGVNYAVDLVREIEGSPIRLFAIDGDLLVVTSRYGKPSFMLWDEHLNALGIPVTMTDGRSVAVAADVLEYTITVSNPADTRRDDVNVMAILPAQLSSLAWTCSPSIGSSCSEGPSVGSVFDIVDIAAEGEVVFTVTAHVPISAAGELMGRVEVWQNGGAVYWDTDTTTVGSWRLRRGNPAGRRVP